MSEKQQAELHRYSIRTVLAFGFLWAVMLAGFGFALAITLLQYFRQAGTSIALPGLFGIFIAIWTVVALTWLRNRPTLELGDDGVRVHQLGSRKFFLKWSDIQSLEDIRRFNIQTGRPLRSFEIRWASGVVKFDQFYSGFRRLIARLNDKIRMHNIPVVVRNYEPHALRETIRAASSRTEKKLLRERGLVSDAKCLEWR
ncbi:MAG: hypothetical protein JSR60_05245 [Proteobacteria bacterium]|nr:hypothetical protein [Pseudomonadota bacterium]